MITFEEATIIAKGIKPAVDAYTEHERAYEFYDSKYSGLPQIGGLDQPGIYVLKEDGTPFGFGTSLSMDIGEEIGEGKLD